ncbi:conserved hypothetical protein [Xanthomonas albilineans GPE PC73]|uniref:CBM2 domain-containing protein n=2 Tax=Xanthomonas albilineans TaxID=29447 RepID=D2UC78_XANAP|nr:conserved hypothetical protein [Xanthomonas albilineans GPE PC73]
MQRALSRNMTMITTHSLKIKANAVGIFAIMTTATAIAAAPSVPQCTIPQQWPTPSNAIVVGNGTAASCTATALSNAVAQGGYVTFNCGAQPVTIPVSQSITIGSRNPTVIDGQGQITLDGQQSTRILLVNAWSALSVRNIQLQNGSSVQPPSNTSYDPGTWGGGAIKVGYQGKLEIINSQFISNRSSIGGGVLFAGSDADVTIVGSSFYKNSSWLGGALYTQLSRLTIVNSDFVGNQAINPPQGFPDAGEFGGGGAIDTDGASLNGYIHGGVGSGGTLSLCGTVVNNNVAANGSGGLTLWAYAPDTIDVKYSTFANNVATSGLGGAGRISLGFTDASHSGSTMTTPGIINVTESSFISNKSQNGNAGALYMDCYGACDISNSTFYGNYASNVGSVIQHTGWPSSVGDQGNVTVRFNNVTFAENSQGAALFGDRFDIHNSIFTSKTERSFCSSQNNHGDNIIEHSDKGAVWPFSCLKSGSVKSADPQLSAPADNGGPTLTMLPAANSPAYASGVNCREIDQRGYSRNTALCDLGAVEIGAKSSGGGSSGGGSSGGGSNGGGSRGGGSNGGGSSGGGSSGGGSSGGPSFSTKVIVDSNWQTGYCERVQVTNTGNTTGDWVVTQTISGTINNLWNANWTPQGSTIKASGMDWNKTLAPGAMAEFGFCASR